MSKVLNHRYLPNYLRTHRKRAGFSQEEIAFLLGIATSGQISRYERFLRKPTLAVVLAMEIVFELPASEIFSGVRQEIQQQICRRAVLLEQTVLRRGRQLSRKKMELLGRIAGSTTPLRSNH